MIICNGKIWDMKTIFVIVGITFYLVTMMVWTQYYDTHQINSPVSPLLPLVNPIHNRKSDNGDIYAKPVPMFESNLNDLKKFDFDISTPINNGILTDNLKSFTFGSSNLATVKHQENHNLDSTNHDKHLINASSDIDEHLTNRSDYETRINSTSLSTTTSTKDKLLKENEKFKNVSITITTNSKTIHENKHNNESTPSSVILTSWLTYEKDPQRGKQVPQTIDYIWNFYTTCRFLGLRVVIFHDHLPPEFVKKYSTDKISFEKIEPTKSFSTNDLRFIIYQQYLTKHPYEWILMTDASDVYFNNDPMVRMASDPKEKSLFLSPDIGTFESNRWVKEKMKKCYPTQTKSWIHEWKLKVFNAGVWGGNKKVIQCILNCIVHDLTTIVKGRGNCNMGTVNWCIRFGKCADKKDLESNNVKDKFVNPFREDCSDTKFSIIHNKCVGTEGKVCAILKDKIIKYKLNNGKSCNNRNR